MAIRIAFSGRIGAGKTTIAQELAKHINCPVISFSELLKSITTDIQEKCGIRPFKDRILLQTLGAHMRSYNPNVFINYIRDTYMLNDTSVSYIVDDVRFLNELIMLRECGFRIIRLTRQSQEFNPDISENSILSADCDLVIPNDDTVDAVIRQIMN